MKRKNEDDVNIKKDANEDSHHPRKFSISIKKIKTITMRRIVFMTILNLNLERNQKVCLKKT